CRPAIDNRQVLEGIFWIFWIFWIAWTGSPWRDLPERFGKWNTVWRRFARRPGTGLYEEIMAAVAASGAGDLTIQMIDSTVIPLPGSACLHAREGAHQHSAGARKGGLI
ncbi:MAG: transposase, partial [Planctomycetota bacterium]